MRTLLLCLTLTTVLTAATLVVAQKINVLHSFAGTPTDGAVPYGGPVRDAAGNLYGATTSGGTSGNGAVYRIDAHGNETVLHDFAGQQFGDGSFPFAGLILDSEGKLYGTTEFGGIGGFGTVFRIDSAGNETVLHRFGGTGDGSNPISALLRDPDGNLYGTAVDGGTSGDGVVFKEDSSGNETVLYSFRGYPNDGSQPGGRLIMDSRGNLYGTTQSGGISNLGTVFKLDLAGTETVLHSFTGSDGSDSLSGLVLDGAGNLFGTTVFGGAFSYGVVFELDPAGNETVLHSFTGKSDGAYPGDLLQDRAGNLYGTTSAGGGTPCVGDIAPGCGVVFKLTRGGELSVLHHFRSGSQGVFPSSDLVEDLAGDFYGSTFGGGAHQYGVVFKLTP